MLRKGMKVKVYDGDLIGWTNGILVHELSKNRWVIFTDEESQLNRYIKEEYNEMKKDGCGYVVESKHCPICGGYEIEETDEPCEMVCYECDTYWNYTNGEILHEGNPSCVE